MAGIAIRRNLRDRITEEPGLGDGHYELCC